MRILDFPQDDEHLVLQAAQLLVDCFAEHWPNAWPDLASAKEEMAECFEEGRVNLVAVDEQGKLLGWIGASDAYEGPAWELHPLAVQVEQQGLGVGRALVIELEKRLVALGANTIYLGTDDEDGMTSLSNCDLYDDLGSKIAKIQNFKGHPYEFYQRLGYHIVGVIPDANGPGKPDIMMAKNIGKKEGTE